MAWNPSPKVADARRLARKHGADRVIIVLLSGEKGTMETISYGETKRLCDEAGRLADVAYDAVYNALDVGAGMCLWSYDEDYDAWDTNCDKAFQVTSDTPKGGGFQYCPYCSRRIAWALMSEPAT